MEPCRTLATISCQVQNVLSINTYPLRSIFYVTEHI